MAPQTVSVHKYVTAANGSNAPPRQAMYSRTGVLEQHRRRSIMPVSAQNSAAELASQAVAGESEKFAATFAAETGTHLGMHIAQALCMVADSVSNNEECTLLLLGSR